MESQWSGGQVNRQKLEETMYIALSLLLYLWDQEEQRGRDYLKLVSAIFYQIFIFFYQMIGLQKL